MSRTQQGALAGAAVGAVLGATRDDDSNNEGRDAARGAILGAAAGAIAGNVLDRQAQALQQSLSNPNIQVINRGLRHGPPEVLARIFRGESVDPAEYYFRTVGEFEAPLGPHDWLNKAIFLGAAERRMDEAIVRFHRVD